MRHGTCTVWLFVEPLGQRRTANAAARRTAVDWTRQVQAVADHSRDRRAKRLMRVCNNLNTHTYASFYQTFSPAEARCLAQRVRLLFTLQHGRGFNRAERN